MRNKSAPSVQFRLASAPWRARCPNYTSSLGAHVTTKRTGEFFVLIFPVSSIVLRTRIHSIVPSTVMPVDHTSGPIVGWDIEI